MEGTSLAESTIENPIINSPFVEPEQHFLMTADGKVTGEIAPRRRPSEFFVPVAQPRKRSAQLSMDQFGGPTRQQPNEIVNEIRQAVGRWRLQDCPSDPGPTDSEPRAARLNLGALQALDQAARPFPTPGLSAVRPLGDVQVHPRSLALDDRRLPVRRRARPGGPRDDPGRAVGTGCDSVSIIG